MFLKSLKLRNIRSYTSQEIEFPKGSVLLSGDIGSGKTTILLAVEFALFGIMRGTISGDALLRNGKKTGYVELNFDLNGKDITIKRALKRLSSGVQQDSGYAIINGTKKEGTAVELKSMVLDLLGYPKELVTKSKALVYRYTVYTPQEEMNHILFEDKDSRLDTLRRVFEIDKYKRIKENSAVYIKALKERAKELEGAAADLEEKQKQKAERIKIIEKLDKDIDKIEPRLQKSKVLASAKRREIGEKEKALKEFLDMKKKLEMAEVELKQKLEQRKSNNAEKERLEKEIISIKKEIGDKEGLNLDDITKEIKSNENTIKHLEDTLKEIAKKASEFDVMKRNAKEIKQKISKLSKCPTCLQDVSSDYKGKVISREESRIKDAEESISVYKKQEKQSEHMLEKAKQKLESLRTKKSSHEILLLKKKNINEKLDSINTIEAKQQKIKKDVGAINLRKIDLNREIEKNEKIEENFSRLRKEFEDAQKELHSLEMDKLSLEKEKQGILDFVKELDKDIKQKKDAKNRLSRTKELSGWLDVYFVGLMDLIEKQVMANVHSQFDALLQQWFNAMIEEENVSIRLDDSFTPVVTQNGYDIDISHLSGGEKTSCALAYRLALNKVINDLISNIQTKDLIVLDEPTDGFSTEQLDNIRDVLEELGMSQTIIVSHEAKIESFVDSVIRINKQEHISAVI